MRGWKCRDRYTVYDNRTGFPVAISQTADVCANLMGIKVGSFYAAMCRPESSRWMVVKEGKCRNTVKVTEEEPKTIGDYMRKCRKDHGISQRDLANISGVRSSSISLYENNCAFPSLMNVISLADALDVTIDELIGRKVE